MQDLARLRADTLSRWRELVAAAVESIDYLVESFLEQVMAIPPYGAGAVPRDDLAEAAYRSLSLLVRNLAEGRPVDDLGDLPAQLGRRRARQGIPAESLAEAVRLDFTLLWSFLLFRAHSRDTFALVMHVDELWSVVDTYARSVHKSYLEEIALIAREEQDHQRRFLLELFRPIPNLQTRIGQLAAALDTSETAMYRVAVAPLANGDEVYRAQANLRAAEERLFVVEWSGAIVAFWPASLPSANYRDELQFRWLSEGRAGFVPDADGLSAVPAAAESALDISRALKDGQSGLITFSEVWDRMARQKLDRGAHLLPQVLSGLNACPQDERLRIEETIRSYLASGSVVAVATELYCHRNTVVKRLQRFSALTGLDVTIPRDAALALLALS